MCETDGNEKVFLVYTFSGGIKISDKTRERIIQCASELFNSRGYRNVTMDEIVARLGISKRTIYQHFSGKEEIAAEVIRAVMERIEKKIDLSVGASHDPIERLRQIFAQIKGEITQLNPLFLEDIQRYSPQLWEMVDQFRSKKILLLEKLIQEGQEAGLFKKINPQLVVLIFSSIVRETIRPDVIARYGFPVEDVFDAVIEIFLGGVLK